MNKINDFDDLFSNQLPDFSGKDWKNVETCLELVDVKKRLVSLYWAIPAISTLFVCTVMGFAYQLHKTNVRVIDLEKQLATVQSKPPTVQRVEINNAQPLDFQNKANVQIPNSKNCINFITEPQILAKTKQPLITTYEPNPTFKNLKSEDSKDKNLKLESYDNQVLSENVFPQKRELASEENELLKNNIPTQNSELKIAKNKTLQNSIVYESLIDAGNTLSKKDLLVAGADQVFKQPNDLSERLIVQNQEKTISIAPLNSIKKFNNSLAFNSLEHLLENKIIVKKEVYRTPLSDISKIKKIKTTSGEENSGISVGVFSGFLNPNGEGITMANGTQTGVRGVFGVKKISETLKLSVSTEIAKHNSQFNIEKREPHRFGFPDNGPKPPPSQDLQLLRTQIKEFSTYAFGFGLRLDKKIGSKFSLNSSLNWVMMLPQRYEIEYEFFNTKQNRVEGKKDVFDNNQSFILNTWSPRIGIGYDISEYFKIGTEFTFNTQLKQTKEVPKTSGFNLNLLYRFK